MLRTCRRSLAKATRRCARGEASALWLSTAWDGRHRRHGVYGTMEYDAQPRDRHDSLAPYAAPTRPQGAYALSALEVSYDGRHLPPWKRLLAQPGPDAHVVQLYQDLR